jgi:hypothetical protein
MLGLKALDARLRKRPGTDAAHLALVAQRINELKSDIAKGGPTEALLRALLYIRMPEGLVDERGFNFLRRMREGTGHGLTISAFKKLVREQFFMLLLDERRAVEAIPAMLDKDPDQASRAASHLQRLISVVGLRSQVSKDRLDEIKRLLEDAGVRERLRAAARAKSPSEPVQAVRTHAAGRSKHA